ncbi:MAG: hypothetical protein OXB89_04595 [Anaerolineaceae bacterium]|nr:hypothetical protein [Anaerolineaceae bacterium]
MAGRHAPQLPWLAHRADLAVTETISWGILYYAFAVLIRPMKLDTGWSRTELTDTFSLALLPARGPATRVAGK